MIRLAVAAAIIDREGRILLAQRGPGVASHTGEWELPAGEVRPGEEILDALAREVLEELDVRVLGRPYLISTDLESDAASGLWVTRTYAVESFSGIPRIMEPIKCSAIGWFKVTRPPRPLMALAARDLAQLRHLLRATPT